MLRHYALKEKKKINPEGKKSFFLLPLLVKYQLCKTPIMSKELNSLEGKYNETEGRITSGNFLLHSYVVAFFSGAFRPRKMSVSLGRHLKRITRLNQIRSFSMAKTRT